MTAPANDPMANLPQLPSGTSPTTAATWAAATLLREAVRQGWAREDLRKALFVLCLNFVDDLDDAAAHAEVQEVLDLLRAP